MAQAPAVIDSAARGRSYTILRSPFPVQHDLSTPHEALDARLAATKQ